MVNLIIGLLFAVVFVEALVAYVRRRDALQRDVVFVFSAMAVVFVLEIWRRVAGEPPRLVSGVTAVLLLAQPYLTMRLVARLRPVPQWLRRTALAGFAVTALPFGLGRPLPVPMILAAVGVFVAVEAIAAGFLVAEARRRSGSSRIRLGLAAAATGAFAFALLVAGAGSAGAAANVANTIARVVALASGAAYLAAFAPPRWMRRWWSASAGYAVARRLLRAPAGESAEATWQRYVDTVCAVAGADAAAVRIDDVEIAYAGRRDLDGHNPIAVPLGLPGGGSGTLVLINTHRRLFSDDDVVLLGELGAQAALLAERGALLAEQERRGVELAADVDSLSLASKAKSDFLASMSHELRTPLNAIIGFSDLMAGPDMKAGDDQRLVPAEWVSHIRTSGRHLLSLINDILDLAKVEAGRIDLKEEPLPPPTVIAEVVTALRALTEQKHLRVTTDVPALTVIADRIRLRQILDNLLSNAIKFTPDGGSIHIGATQTATEVQIGVTDTGVGIAEEDQKAVFDEFAQVGDPAARQAGTGLGLALTRRLVEAHGGTIHLRSALGQGSTFTVCLSRPPQVTAEPTAEAERRPAVRGGGVLIVEDDPAAAELLCTHLRAVGYEPVVAADGQRGLDLAGSIHPDAILLDVLLPDLDGWQVLRRLKADPATRDIPVIIATVLDEHDVGFALGAVDYLVKPIEPDVLVAQLTRYALLPPPPQTPSVLAIDDDPATLELVAATLREHGAHTTLASTGARGIELASRLRFDLIICDLLLPDLDGFRVIAQLSAHPATRDTPVLVLTACDPSETDAARLTGAVLDVVYKGESAASQLRDWLARIAPHH